MAGIDGSDELAHPEVVADEDGTDEGSEEGDEEGSDNHIADHTREVAGEGDGVVGQVAVHEVGKHEVDQEVHQPCSYALHSQHVQFFLSYVKRTDGKV